jgi:hypothetical protein
MNRTLAGRPFLASFLIPFVFQLAAEGPDQACLGLTWTTLLAVRALASASVGYGSTGCSHGN